MPEKIVALTDVDVNIITYDEDDKHNSEKINHNVFGLLRELGVSEQYLFTNMSAREIGVKWQGDNKGSSSFKISRLDVINYATNYGLMTKGVITPMDISQHNYPGEFYRKHIFPSYTESLTIGLDYTCFQEFQDKSNIYKSAIFSEENLLRNKNNSLMELAKNFTKEESILGSILSKTTDTKAAMYLKIFTSLLEQGYEHIIYTDDDKKSLSAVSELHSILCGIYQKKHQQKTMPKLICLCSVGADKNQHKSVSELQKEFLEFYGNDTESFFLGKIKEISLSTKQLIGLFNNQIDPPTQSGNTSVFSLFNTSRKSTTTIDFQDKNLSNKLNSLSSSIEISGKIEGLMGKHARDLLVSSECDNHSKWYEIASLDIYYSFKSIMNYIYNLVEDTSAETESNPHEAPNFILSIKQKLRTRYCEENAEKMIDIFDKAIVIFNSIIEIKDKVNKASVNELNSKLLENKNSVDQNLNKQRTFSH